MVLPSFNPPSTKYENYYTPQGVSNINVSKTQSGSIISPKKLPPLYATSYTVASTDTIIPSTIPFTPMQSEGILSPPKKKFPNLTQIPVNLSSSSIPSQNPIGILSPPRKPVQEKAPILISSGVIQQPAQTVITETPVRFLPFTPPSVSSTSSPPISSTILSPPRKFPILQVTTPPAQVTTPSASPFTPTTTTQSPLPPVLVFSPPLSATPKQRAIKPTPAKTPQPILVLPKTPVLQIVKDQPIRSGEPFVIKFPLFTTILKPVPLNLKEIDQGQARNLAAAYTPDQMIAKNISNIDINKLNPKKTGKGDPSYSALELKKIASTIGIKGKYNKADLVEEIKRKIQQYGISNVM